MANFPDIVAEFVAGHAYLPACLLKAMQEALRDLQDANNSWHVAANATSVFLPTVPPMRRLIEAISTAWTVNELLAEERAKLHGAGLPVCASSAGGRNDLYKMKLLLVLSAARARDAAMYKLIALPPRSQGARPDA